MECVTLKVGCEDTVAHMIPDDARTGGYGTIAVSRHGMHGTKGYSGGDVADHSARETPDHMRTHNATGSEQGREERKTLLMPVAGA